MPEVKADDNERWDVLEAPWKGLSQGEPKAGLIRCMWLVRHLQYKMGFGDLQEPWSANSVGSVSHIQKKLESIHT